jgi:hypothetical protein
VFRHHSHLLVPRKEILQNSWSPAAAIHLIVLLLETHTALNRNVYRLARQWLTRRLP